MFGHMVRLPTDTPVQQAIKEVRRPTKRPVGKPTSSWIQTMTRQLDSIGMTWDEAVQAAQDRDGWRQVVKGHGVVGNAGCAVARH